MRLLCGLCRGHQIHRSMLNSRRSLWRLRFNSALTALSDALKWCCWLAPCLKVLVATIWVLLQVLGSVMEVTPAILLECLCSCIRVPLVSLPAEEPGELISWDGRKPLLPGSCAVCTRALVGEGSGVGMAEPRCHRAGGRGLLFREGPEQQTRAYFKCVCLPSYRCSDS